MSSSYGTEKSSSSGVPSESSGMSSSAPVDESSSGSSGGIYDSSSGMSSGMSSSGSSGSSSGGCSFYIFDVQLGAADDEMVFSVFNDGPGVLEITAILSSIPGVTLDADTPVPIFLLSGIGITLTVQSNPPATDLRGTGFTVETDCGNQSDVFPIA